MTFEEWAKPILGDNPNWRESGDVELARQAYQAGRDSMKAECVKVCDAEIKSWKSPKFSYAIEAVNYCAKAIKELT